ncbi:MAG TPA: cupin domain-containing protein [Nitrolancea sp.]|nr:cupin domain-containing protein [Nitrolancea sp.]
MSIEPTVPVRIPRGQDRFGEQHDVGNGSLTFKVTGPESHGALLIAELAHHTPGGPPRHVHPHQDEWFSVIEGHYQIVVGDGLFDLEPGDSVFGPRGVPHTWAYVGGGGGRLLIIVSPAWQMEEFLRALSDQQQMAPQDPEFWQRYGLELLGPPILAD